MAVRPPIFRPSYAPPAKRSFRRLNERRGSAASRGYDADWRRLRALVVCEEPLCRRCHEAGLFVATEVVDHIVPVEVAPERRLDRTNLQGLCRPCHAVKTYEDLARYRDPTEPLDPRLAWPGHLRPSLVPLTIVCGPPASGKSTLVRERAGSGDIVIDLDEIHRRLTGLDTRRRSETESAAAMAERNRMLVDLSRRPLDGRAWYIVGAPRAEERGRWASMLAPTEVVVMATPERICAARIEAEPDRASEGDWMRRAVRRWWERYTTREGETVIR